MDSLPALYRGLLYALQVRVCAFLRQAARALGGTTGEAHLFTVVSGIGHTDKVLIGPPIQVSVFSTDDAVASIAWFALTAVHGITEVAEVVALGILVAVMCAICAWVTWLTHLGDTRETPWRTYFHSLFSPRDTNNTCF